MTEVSGNIWKFHDLGYTVCITTNGMIKKDGSCVMGRGVARDAKIKFSKLPLQLGNKIRSEGNIVHWFPEYRLFSFPVKHVWWDRADLDLIVGSCKRLVDLADQFDVRMSKVIYLVRPGCGNGQLTWGVVKPIITPILDDRFVVVQN
jgi:hypothetical protein